MHRAAALCVLAWPALASAQMEVLRFDDDFAAQRAHCAATRSNASPGSNAACWKEMPLGTRLPWTLSLGGEARWRYEYTHHPAYGEDPQDKRGAVLQRYAAFVDLRAGNRIRGFVQINSAWATGRVAGPSPVDENRLDLENAFVEVSSQASAGSVLGLRHGIQELRLGSARLVDVREGPNVRRTFQGTRGWAQFGAWRVDAFDVSPRLALPASFDDRRSLTQDLQGVYATRNQSNSGLDLYALHYDARDARYVQGSAQERRWSLGVRSFGQRGPWDWNWEAVLQGGHFGDASIRAWTLATDTGYTFTGAQWSPRVALLAAAASGDRHPGDGRLETFNPMFPRGNYFGEDATLGPHNFFNLQPTVSFQPHADVSVEASLDVFWRQSPDDGVYAPAGALVRAPGGSRARHVATVASLGTTWEPTPQWTSSVVLAYLKPGRFLRETGDHQPLGYIELTLRYRF
ncbi:alginate export family protein [Aerolutibacter daejeonensis]|uniref:alginate export family protein n=1 Tax=Aerolutibacter daejeonensis TaxID=346181 RepID=UPI00068B5598|nr:alginate export family protein [Lysobacter daejeonensis]